MASRRLYRPDGSGIPPLPGGLNPLLTDRNKTSVPYSRTIFKMQTIGFHYWGFVIVRTTPYNDDNEEWWDAMLKRIYTDAEKTLADEDTATSSLLKPLLRWEVL